MAAYVEVSTSPRRRPCLLAILHPFHLLFLGYGSHMANMQTMRRFDSFDARRLVLSCECLRRQQEQHGIGKSSRKNDLMSAEPKPRRVEKKKAYEEGNIGRNRNLSLAQ